MPRSIPLLMLAGTLLAGCSQIVAVPPAPDGSASAVEISRERGVAHFDRQGYVHYSDRWFDVVYRPDSDAAEAEFGPALAALDEAAANLPPLPHSRVILLAHPKGPTGSLEVSVAGQPPVRLDQAAQGTFIDGYPAPPFQVRTEELGAEFGPLLAALEETVKASRSYIILLESPDGADSRVIYQTGGQEILLDQVGASIALDGIEFRPDADLAKQDFTPAREATGEILEKGLPPLAHSYVALLESPRGPLGEVELLAGPHAGTVLRARGESVYIDGYPNAVHAVDPARLSADFSETLEALPPPPVTFTLYFHSGSARLSAEARQGLEMMLDEIRRRGFVTLTIAGHADTVGKPGLNDKLSRTRSEAIAALVRDQGLNVGEVEITAWGETALAVPTPDNTPEQNNRRVEVVVN